MRTPAPSASAQRGAAIITALLVVAMAAMLVAGLLWRQQVEIRRIENQRLRDQVQWAARGATDWARLILRNSADHTAIDALGSGWAKPLAPTRVADLLGHIAGDDALDDSTFVSGSIEDAQAYFNLRNLLVSPAPGALQPDPSQLQHFQRLLQLLGMDTRLAGPVAIRLRSAMLAQAAHSPGVACAAAGVIGISAPPPAADSAFTDRPGLSDEDNSATRPLQPLDLDWLLDVPGFTPQNLARLRPYVTILPMPSMININTATPQVLAAMIVGLNLDQAKQLVNSRNTAYFLNLNDLNNRLGDRPTALQPDTNQLDVRSCFFIVHGRIDRERAHLLSDTLVFRDPVNHTTRIIRIHDLY